MGNILVSSVVPIGRLEKIRALADAICPGMGNAWQVRLSPTGQEPATHAACHGWMPSELADVLPMETIKDVADKTKDKEKKTADPVAALAKAKEKDPDLAITAKETSDTLADVTQTDEEWETCFSRLRLVVIQPLLDDQLEGAVENAELQKGRP